MRHRLAGRKLSRPTGHRRAMLRSLVTDLLRRAGTESEYIQTTEAKAREIRPLTEKVITRGKNGTLHDRRLVAAFLTDEKVVRKVFEEVAPRYQSRPGGYTRLVKMGRRKGDAAPMALIELVP